MENIIIKGRFNYLRLVIIVSLFAFVVLFTGFSSLVELQDRDFVLALGVSFQDGQYELTFALPDLSAITSESKEDSGDSGNGQIRTYKSVSLSEIEELYNHGSNKRLDFRHLEVLILDESITSSAERLPAFFDYIENNYEISRNILTFFYSENVKELIETKGTLNGSIGDYLKQLENNNQRRNGWYSVTLGDLINSFSQKKGLVIPSLKLNNDRLEINGAAVLQDAGYVRELNSESLNICHAINGIGKELHFHTKDNLIFHLKEFKSKTHYSFEKNKPVIELTITGTAVVSSGSDITENKDITAEINHFLKAAAEKELSTCYQTDQKDYFNLYDKSSIKNREMWLSYQNRRAEFINDVIIRVTADVEMQ